MFTRPGIIPIRSHSRHLLGGWLPDVPDAKLLCRCTKNCHVDCASAASALTAEGTAEGTPDSKPPSHSSEKSRTSFFLGWLQGKQENRKIQQNWKPIRWIIDITRQVASQDISGAFAYPRSIVSLIGWHHFCCYNRLLFILVHTLMFQILWSGVVQTWRLYTQNMANELWFTPASLLVNSQYCFPWNPSARICFPLLTRSSCSVWFDGHLRGHTTKDASCLQAI